MSIITTPSISNNFERTNVLGRDAVSNMISEGHQFFTPGIDDEQVAQAFINHVQDMRRQLLLREQLANIPLKDLLHSIKNFATPAGAVDPANLTAEQRDRVERMVEPYIRLWIDLERSSKGVTATYLTEKAVPLLSLCSEEAASSFQQEIDAFNATREERLEILRSIPRSETLDIVVVDVDGTLILDDNGELQLNEEVIQTLRLLQAAGVPFQIATLGDPENRLAALRALGMDESLLVNGVVDKEIFAGKRVLGVIDDTKAEAQFIKTMSDYTVNSVYGSMTNHSGDTLSPERVAASLIEAHQSWVRARAEIVVESNNTPTTL
ncbi:MAG: hypothetical protein GC136_02670 [Alphaproteobacteria bacterium]|nr:hypothetical protein [Alphaproteobacteria bacterium]